MKILLALFLALIPLTAIAQTSPQFAFPIDCILGQDCWVINYVDTDPHPKSARDFTCGNKTSEGHKGTAIAIRSRLEMQKGVNVMAAMDGKILRIRDGEDDLPKTNEQYQAIRDANKDCGNGIIIEHDNNTQSFYCHLKKGSINVKPGDEIKQGDIIAQIGQSGYSEFPQLHITMIQDGAHIDPFTANFINDGCGKATDNMWEPDITYEPYSVFDGGFSDKTPDFKAIEKGQSHPKTLSTNSKSLIYWAGFYHATKGDTFTLTITDPSGNVVIERKHIIEKSRKLPSYFYTGRKLNGKALTPGTYTGTITYQKGSYPPKTFTHTVKVEEE